MSKNQDSAVVSDILSSSKSRAQFLKGAAVAAAGLGLAPAAVHASAARGGSVGGGTTESTQTILNVAATAEAAAVTALYNVHVAVLKGQLKTSGIAIPVGTLVSIVRAILREEQDHYAFLTGAGGRPLFHSFTFPQDIFHSAMSALGFLEVADTAFVAAYLAANREFARAGHITLAQYAYQIGGTEAEHRALARAGAGKLPNNKSYESDLFPTVSAAADALGKMGLFKPGLPYPGAAAVDRILATTVSKDVTAGVTQRHP